MSNNITVHTPDLNLQHIDTNSTFGPIDIGIEINKLPTIELDATTKSSLAADITTKNSLTSDSTVSLGITELPVIRLEFSMKPTRIHFPVNMKFNICALGMEVLSFATCGESMVVIEDYYAHALEECR